MTKTEIMLISAFSPPSELLSPIIFIALKISAYAL
jgi:hypothetical protein